MCWCVTLIPVCATTISQLRSGVSVNDRVHGARVPSPRHESIESCNYITTCEPPNRAEFRNFHIRRNHMALNITLIIGTCRLCDGTFMYPSEPRHNNVFDRNYRYLPRFMSITSNTHPPQRK